MPTIKTIWYEDTCVRSSETDFLKRWKVSSFFKAMQDAAANHASHLGLDYRKMIAQEMVFILSRVKIRFFEFPRLGESVTIQTWPKGIHQKIFFMRDFHLTGPNGRKLASATTAWLLVNPQARRIMLPQSLPVKVPDNGGLSAIDQPLEKLAPLDALEACHSVRADYSSVDLMEHVNNARYVDWACDCFSFDEHRSRRLAWMQINYVNEVKPGESVALARGQRKESPGTWYVTGTNENSGAKAFEAELRWEEAHEA
ncbi:MAG: hypothetical protein GX491_14650 [Chloroflexi bacterium]|nr:hypothetical protein [Chloroflexota bacterium]